MLKTVSDCPAEGCLHLTTQYSDHCKLMPQDELELINYIGDLEKQGLLPTRTIVQNFASTIADVCVSSSWVTCF
jgi:hypothetical protein